MLELIVTLVVIGVVYWIASLVLPEPIPKITAAVLFVLFVLVPLLDGKAR